MFHGSTASARPPVYNGPIFTIRIVFLSKGEGSMRQITYAGKAHTSECDDWGMGNRYVHIVAELLHHSGRCHGFDARSHHEPPCVGASPQTATFVVVIDLSAWTHLSAALLQLGLSPPPIRPPCLLADNLLVSQIILPAYLRDSGFCASTEHCQRDKKARNHRVL